MISRGNAKGIANPMEGRNGGIDSNTQGMDQKIRKVIEAIVYFFSEVETSGNYC